MTDNIQDIVKLTPKFWLQVGEKVVSLSVSDSNEGKLPLGISRYKNKTYREYKSSGMSSKRTGKRLRGFTGTRINTNVGSVNMELTGELWRGFRAGNVTDRSVEMSFRPQHKSITKGGRRGTMETSKILEGNKNIDSKRDLLTLSEKNQEKVFDLINKELDNKLIAWSRQGIVKIIK